MKNLTNEELCVLIKQGNAEAKRWIIEKNYDFITAKAKEAVRGKHRWGIELDDLIQVAALALHQAVEKYDPASGNTFMTYAGTAVINGLRQYIRSQMKLFTNRITWQDGHTVVSMDEPLDDETDDTYHDVAFDPTFPTPEQEYIHKETIAELHEALDGIGDRERQYLLYRYGFTDEVAHTRAEAGEHFHFTDSRVKKEEENALSAIRHELWVVIPEKRYAVAEDWLTRVLVCDNELHAVELRLKSQRKMGKKVKSAVYEYIADYEGTWGEIRFDIAKGTAEIVTLADGDTVKTNKFALRAMEQRFAQTDVLPEKITLTFIDRNQINSNIWEGLQK